MNMNRANTHQTGFSLLEILIALVVISMGLIGLAGIQSVAINNTNTSRIRGIAAIEAESIASAMHANPAYWQNISGTITQSTVPTAGSCASSTCNASQVAGYDVSTWQSALSANQIALPSASGTFSCTSSSSGPVTCTILVSWQEKTIEAQKNTATTSTSYSTASYSMVVQP